MTTGRVFDRELLNNSDYRTHFEEITLALASPEKIRSWSYGEVRLPETINYRTFKPEQGGLFCAKIFGPIKDYECLCGKYKRVKHRNIICEKCGVEVTAERVRRERMGHIELACPVAHILFFKSVPSRIGLMMDLTMRDIERVLYFEAYVVLDPKRVSDEDVAQVLKTSDKKPFDRGMLISTDEYIRLRQHFGRDDFEVGIGAEGLRDFLKSMDLNEEIDILRGKLSSTSSDNKMSKIQKRIKLMENFRHANLRPEWMILEALPVLPPGLRPLVQLEGGRFTTSDLNDLYRRVINRNNRLRKLIELDAPAIIINNEKRMLQEAVDSLLDNGRRGKPAVGANKRPLKSLADIIKGKSGRFRQNLLGKRVDFSARSVIVVGPNLKLHQCGLPKYMALSLFRPFVFQALMNEGIVSNIKQARLRLEEPDGEVWDALERVIHQHPILLNRAPTLHRLGVQAFEPILIEGKAIQLHPLVCVAFNADFDGDQMAVHVPLSTEAQAEARMLMLSSNNILAPANGDPIILPTQDIVLGIYYATREKTRALGEGMCFTDLSEMEMALSTGVVELQAKIKFPLPKRQLRDVLNGGGGSANGGAGGDEDEDDGDELVLTETTVGRVLMLEFYPQQMPFSHINRTLKKKDLTDLVNKIFRVCGLRETVIFCDNLMRFGFRQSTRAGISICMDDMVIPTKKADIVHRAEQEMQEAQQQFRTGLLTEDERYNKSVDLWDKAGEEISREMMRELSYEQVRDARTGKQVAGDDGAPQMQDSFNSLYMMADSGARGSQTQIKQLAGMRGLMTKPDGRIMETAITANFREGLTALQYFLSTHGARKGLSDTALKTANSGYLTRRLVDVAQDTVIVSEDCGTKEGIVMRAVLMGGEVVMPLAARALGRVLAVDLPHPQTGQILYPAGTLINEAEAEAIADVGVDEVVVRSPVKCRLPHGLCTNCYGRDLARGRLVQQGESVGVIAAQSIGEPGTQLTMRTFHIGGAASRAVVARNVDAKTDGVLRVNARTVTNAQGKLVVVSRGGEMSVHDKSGHERERYRLQYGEVLHAKKEGTVKAGQALSHRDPLTQPIIAEHGGIAHIVGLEEGVNARLQADETTGVESWVMMEDKRSGKKVKPVQIRFTDEKGNPVCIQNTETEVSITLRPGMTILAREGKMVNVGDVVATIPQEAGKSRDITGGLPRVAELFEAREPKETSILSPVDGRVVILPMLRQKQHFNIIAKGSEPLFELQIPREKGYEAAVAQGAHVKKDQKLIKKPVKPSDETDKEPPAARGKKSEDAAAVVNTPADGIVEISGETILIHHPDSVREISVPKGRNVLVQDGMEVKKGEEIVEGDANPHEILAKRGIETLTNHIVDEVQAVYRLQGVSINDKHIEVIVHQMLRCVVVDEPGDSRYMRGDQLVRSQIMEENERIRGNRGKEATYHHILLGITKASLATDSFISAASFQETARVLTEAAISGRRDKLRGLKENVIVGRLIPAGTGFVRYNKMNRDAEREVAEAYRKEGMIQPDVEMPPPHDATTA